MNPIKTPSSALVRFAVVACLAAGAAWVAAQSPSTPRHMNTLTASAMSQAIVTANDAAVPVTQTSPRGRSVEATVAAATF
jgi:long-subunit acyl-CoA synthetase (AMP-forming)